MELNIHWMELNTALDGFQHPIRRSSTPHKHLIFMSAQIRSALHLLHVVINKQNCALDHQLEKT